MRAHDVGFRARGKFLADVGNQLSRTQNCLLDRVRLVGLRRKVARKTENPDNDKKNSSLHREYLLSPINEIGILLALQPASVLHPESISQLTRMGLW
jgi:hypothetical protein